MKTSEQLIQGALISVHNHNEVLLKDDAIRLLKEFAAMHVRAAKDEISKEAMMEVRQTGHMTSHSFSGLGSPFMSCYSAKDFSVKQKGVTTDIKVNSAQILSIYPIENII